MYREKANSVTGQHRGKNMDSTRRYLTPTGLSNTNGTAAQHVNAHFVSIAAPLPCPTLLTSRYRPPAAHTPAFMHSTPSQETASAFSLPPFPPTRKRGPALVIRILPRPHTTSASVHEMLQPCAEPKSKILERYTSKLFCGPYCLACKSVWRILDDSCGP